MRIRVGNRAKAGVGWEMKIGPREGQRWESIDKREEQGEGYKSGWTGWIGKKASEQDCACSTKLRVHNNTPCMESQNPGWQY